MIRNQANISLHRFHRIDIATVVLLLQLLIHPAYAQPFTDIGALSYSYHLPAAYKESNPIDKRILHIRSAEVLFPLALGQGSYLLVGGQYNKYDFGFDFGITLSQQFTVSDLRLGALIQHKSVKDKTLLLLIPKWSGEDPAFADRNFQMGGVILHTHQLKEHLAFKLGLYYNREHFGNFFMPLLGIDWQINEKLLLYGTMPGNLQLHKTFTPSLAASLSYASPSGSLLMENRSDYIRIGKSFPPFVILTADVHWTVFNPLVIKASFGHSLWREYAQYDHTDLKDETGIYADYKDGFVMRLSLIARVLNK